MDPILFWNDVALEANRRSFTNGLKEQDGPTLSSRALAIVHLAMYDAFAAVSGNPPATLPPYMTCLPAVPTGSTLEGSVAGAAYTALVSLYPGQKTFFEAKLLESSNKQDPGLEFGVKVGRMILEDRANDDDAGAKDYSPSIGPGYHKVDPDNKNQPFHGPFYGEKTPTFSVNNRTGISLNPPYSLNHAQYKKALKDVLGKGIAPELMGTLPKGVDKRDFAGTIQGIFWAYDGARGLGTPPRLYNLIIRAIAKTQETTPAENARLFAFINTAMGDAGILAWQEKYRYEFWRPVVAIREDSDDPDTGWLPLGSPNSNPDENNLPLGAMQTNNNAIKNFTPPFPAYPSGHATFGAAAFHIAELYFNEIRAGKDVAKDLKFVSEELNGVTRDNRGAVRPKVERTFDRGFAQMIEENGFSRVFLGVHWFFDAFALKGKDIPDLSKNIGGASLGIKIAENIFNSKMQKSGEKPQNKLKECRY